MLRRSKLSELALLACLGSGCASSAPRFATSARIDASAPRRAPGVVVAQSSEPPAPTQRANVSERYVVLQAPVSEATARDTVRAFFRAVLHEAPETLDSLLAAQAFSGSGGNRQPARSFWRARLNQLDYGELSGVLVYHDSMLELYRASEVTRLPPNRKLPFGLNEDEIAVRVPIAQTSARSTRLFGDELVFRLHAVAEKFEIAEIWEDFRLP